MKIRLNSDFWLASSLAVLLSILSPALFAQVPVDDEGNLIGNYEPQAPVAETGNEDIPLLSTVDLEELVAPIALYPDDLLAIVLPAAAYPLQIIDAARFLEALENDPDLKPDPEWDDSVVALLNYPEVIKLLNDDIDWTWQLGEAVVSQQADVVAAVETFRDRAYAAGNLKSDSYQNVSHNEGTIEITPVSEDVIYVPYYEPERVVVYQPRPVYYYYPRAYPVYYYPYSSSYYFDHGPFWGVTTAFRIGWFSDSLHVFHHSYYGHPYYGRRYVSPWWYRRPTINIHNTTYVGHNTRVTINRYYGGDRWQRSRFVQRETLDDVRVARSHSYPRSDRQRDTVNAFPARQQSNTVSRESRSSASVTQSRRDRIEFRDRPSKFAYKRHDATEQNRSTRQVPVRPTPAAKDRRESSSQSRDVVKFRDRGNAELIAKNDSARTSPISRPVQSPSRVERDRSSSVRWQSAEKRTPSRPTKRQQVTTRQPGFTSSSDRRRTAAVPQVRAAKQVQVARREAPAARAQPQRQVSRPQPVQKSQRSTSSKTSRPQAQRSQDRSPGRIAARSRQRD
jgi:hypothetical protein